MSAAAGDAARVALETAVFAHGLPRERCADLARALAAAVEEAGAQASIIGIIAGEAIVGMSEAQLRELIERGRARKVNASNLGLAMDRGWDGATTVSATIGLAASEEISVMATGGIGGVHREAGVGLDVSADLVALSRFPVAVVSSGAKSLVDVEATREALETLGVPVVGFGTDRFSAFYQRDSAADVDERFDDAEELAHFAQRELARSGRGIMISNPIPKEHEIDRGRWERWLAEARRLVAEDAPRGRIVTPALLAEVHRLSNGETIEANSALLLSNARLAGRIAGRGNGQ